MTDSVERWELRSWVQYTLGDALLEYELSLIAGEWTLTLNDYEGEGAAGEPEMIPGDSFSWSEPAEFWRAVKALDIHQVMPDDVVDMFRETGDPQLVELADDLDAYVAPPPPPYVRPKGRFAVAPPVPGYCGQYGATQPAGAPVPGGLVLFNFDDALAYRFDASLGSESDWVTEPGIARQRREGATVATMPDGRVLVVGGDGPNGHAIDVYAPGTGAVARHLLLQSARAHPIVAALDDSRVVVIGGRPTSGGWATPDLAVTTEVVDLEANTTSPGPQLSEVRTGATAHCLPGGRVLVVGGKPLPPGNRVHRSTDVLDLQLGTVEAGPEFPGRGGRESHTAIRLRDGRILLVGGHGPGEPGMGMVGPPSIDLLDPRLLSFHRLSDGEMPFQSWAVGTSALELEDGRILVSGGEFVQSGSVSAVVVDLGASTVTEVGPMEAGRWKHVSAILPGGRALLAGGHREGAGAEFFLGVL